MNIVTCKCKQELSNHDLPNKFEGVIRGVYEYEEKNVWNCTHCGRLIIEMVDFKGDVHLVYYKPEENYPQNLFSASNSSTVLEEIKRNIDKYSKKLKLYEQVVG